MIERSGERSSGIYVLVALDDDDDDVLQTFPIDAKNKLTIICFQVSQTIKSFHVTSDDISL